MRVIAIRRAKLAHATFSWKDLDPMTQRHVAPDAQVFVLRPGVSTVIGRYRIVCSEVHEDCNGEPAAELWICGLLPKTEFYGETVGMDMRILGTNLVLGFWRVGDGSGAVPLVAEIATK